jgi:hypothetical protein
LHQAGEQTNDFSFPASPDQQTDQSAKVSSSAASSGDQAHDFSDQPTGS